MISKSTRVLGALSRCKLFTPKSVKMFDKTEDVIVGGRDQFTKVKNAFSLFNQIGVIGYSSQGPAQAQNLRDTLASMGSQCQVTVGLRPNSPNIARAERDGFTRASGTLSDVDTVVQTSDLLILLTSDAACVSISADVFSKMKPGAILGLSHGFLLGYLNSISQKFPDHISVIAVCPKGMGPSVRRLYEQGASVNGAGINCSVAIHQCAKETLSRYQSELVDVAVAWAVGIGAPYSFETTLEMEYKSDIFGERGVLLGGVHGIIEFLFKSFVRSSMSSLPDLKAIDQLNSRAFRLSAEALTGTLSRYISDFGMKAVLDQFDESDKLVFKKSFLSAYSPLYELLHEIYDEVSSGREIQSVIDLDRRPYNVRSIENTHTWKVGKEYRASHIDEKYIDMSEVHPVSAGVYIACIIAQCDLLRSFNHDYSEVANESIIEAVDSLNPFVHKFGVAYMIDNCSMTAKVGARKWASRFEYILTENFDESVSFDILACKTTNTALSSQEDQEFKEKFSNNCIHEILAVCSTMRPSVSISL